MDNDRLQEISRNVLGTVQIDYAEDIWGIAKELIAALEAARAELAEAAVEKIALENALAHIDSAYKEQLAEAQAEVERLRTENEAMALPEPNV